MEPTTTTMRIQPKRFASKLPSRRIRTTSRLRSIESIVASMAFCWPALLVASVLLVGLEALAQDPPKKLPPIAEPAEDPNDLGPGYPRLNEPWKKDGSKKAPAKATPKPAT